MIKYFDKIYKKGREKFFEEIKENLINNKKTFVVTANPETIMMAENNNNLKEALLDKDTIIIPDGIGIVKGAKILKKDIKETITGIELAENLIKYCDEYNKNLFLFGAKKEVLKALKNKINIEYPNVNIVGSIDGYVENKENVMGQINKSDADVILIALGIPQQEILIYNNLDNVSKGIFVGVGGSFDVLSGMKKRAPKFFIKFHLEWLYRITKEPKRFKRFFESNIKYIFKVFKIRIKEVN